MPTVLARGTLASPEARLDPSAFPAEIELVPGALRASVHQHELNTHSGVIRCWSYVTAGLHSFSQKDVVFTVACDPGADPCRFSTEPLRFAVTLRELAAKGRIVKEGDFSELRGSSFMGRPGLTYTHARPLEGVPMPGSLLAVVSLTAEELEVLKVCGQLRVLSALGHAYREYPFPRWIDRRRKSVISPQSTQGTMLARVPRMPVRGSVRMEGGNILLRVRPEAAAGLGRALGNLSPSSAFALTTELDPASDGCLVWQSAQKEPSAITPPGSRGQRVSGCFALVVPQQPVDGGQLFEDGFGLLLTDTSCEALRRALGAGQSLTLPAAGGKIGLRLEWVEMSYQNAIDGTVVLAEGGFHTYHPREPASAGGAPAAVEVKQVILLTSESDIRARVATADLAAFINEVISVIVGCLSPPAGAAPWELLVDLSAAPGGVVEHRMASRGGRANDEVMQTLRDRIGGVAAPPVREGPVALQIHFRVGSTRTTAG